MSGRGRSIYVYQMSKFYVQLPTLKFFAHIYSRTHAYDTDGIKFIIDALIFFSWVMFQATP